jgi:hypothetical protein
MGAFLFYLQHAPDGVVLNWDAIRTVVTTLTAVGVVGIIKLQISMRDDVRDTKREIGNEHDGTGLLGRVNRIDGRVMKIENRNLRLDAIYADYVRDLEQHDGPERRHSGKKLRASLRATIENELLTDEESNGRTR